MAKICLRSSRVGRSTKNNSSKRPLRINSGGSAVTLLQVAATNTAAFLSCIQPRKDANSRDEPPAHALADSLPSHNDSPPRRLHPKVARCIFPCAAPLCQPALQVLKTAHPGHVLRCVDELQQARMPQQFFLCLQDIRCGLPA